MRARKNAAALAFAPSVSFAFSFSSPPPHPPDWQCPPRDLFSLSLSLSLSCFSFRRLFLLFSPARASSSVPRESRERDDETRKRERRFTGERVSVKNQRRSEFSSVFLSFEYSVFGRFEKRRRTRRLEMESGRKKGKRKGGEKRKEKEGKRRFDLTQLRNEDGNGRTNEKAVSMDSIESQGKRAGVRSCAITQLDSSRAIGGISRLPWSNTDGCAVILKRSETCFPASRDSTRPLAVQIDR